LGDTSFVFTGILKRRANTLVPDITETNKFHPGLLYIYAIVNKSFEAKAKVCNSEYKQMDVI